MGEGSPSCSSVARATRAGHGGHIFAQIRINRTVLKKLAQMKFFLGLTITIVTASAANTFVDDVGFEHAKVDNPRLILSVQAAVTLRHMGKLQERCEFSS